MRRLTLIACVLPMLGAAAISLCPPALQPVSLAMAQELPAVWQRKVQQIQKNIDRSRQALAASGAADLADAFKAKQWMDRLENYRTSLARVPEASDPLLIQARESLSTLEAEFAALKGRSNENGAGAETAAASTSAPPPAAQAAEDSASPAPQLVSGQRVQVNKLNRDLQGALADLVTTGPSPMQSGDMVGRYNQSLQRYAEALGRFAPFRNDPDVRAAADAYQSLAAAVKAEFERARDQIAELGDVQARLATLEETLRANRPPGQLYPPFSLDDARTWVQQLAAAQQAAQAAGGEIQAIAPLAYLPDSPTPVSQGGPYDRKDLDRLLNFANGIQADVNAAINDTQAMLKHRFDFQDQQELGYFRDLDPGSDRDRMNAYLAEGAEGEILERLDQQMALVESIAAYQQAFGKEPTANTLARLEEITTLREKYLRDRAEVLGGYRLPAPASDDAGRIAIAREILANPAYGFGEHGPIVLTTADIVSRDKEVSRDTIKDVDVSLSSTITLSGTRESWHYQWEEFKFATPLKAEDGDEWYVWWITAKKYRSGWEKTPIGRWVSGAATQGSRILEKNFRQF